MNILNNINIKQFENLFEKEVETVNLDTLGKLAEEGNLDCIEMLHNLALRHDKVGKTCENILFDLFSGKTQGKEGIVEEIQQASLKLYEIACNAKEKNNIDMEKLYSPSKLLYIAGSAITDKSRKQDVTNIFSGGNNAQSEHEQLDNDDLWCSNRMMVTDEIDAAMKGLISDTGKQSLNFPIGLIQPHNKSNLLSEQINEKLMCNSIIDKTELFPINTGGHWVLFVLYKNEADNFKKCVVFNSQPELDTTTVKNLTSSAELAGVTVKNIIFINGDMQSDVPNGCGIFVVKAAELLSNNREKEPVTILNEFVKDFSGLSSEEKMSFNLQNRRQLYELYIEDMNRRAG